MMWGEFGMNKGILDARVLANYIIKKCNGKVSPIKLQKSLYFCFAYWGGFVRKGKNQRNELNKDYSEILFDNKIEAWVYGPVVPEVYHEKNLEKYNENEENIFGDTFVKDYIDGILENVLACNDFQLVEISHEDKCWKKNFKKNSIFHNGVIPPEEIIREYATK